MWSKAIKILENNKPTETITTKEKLEQLGWKESIVNKKNIYKEFDGIYIFTSRDGIDINGTNEDTFIDINELQLILDYIKEQDDEKSSNL